MAAVAVITIHYSAGGTKNSFVSVAQEKHQLAKMERHTKSCKVNNL